MSQIGAGEFHRSMLAFASLVGVVAVIVAPNVTPVKADRPTAADVERVSTVAPFPRGLVMKDGTLYTLCRGRVRGAGGVSAEVEDQAGTIYAIDPNVTQPIAEAEISSAVRTNGRVFAKPTSPPFKLWDRDASPPQSDRETDRPYCTLRYHEPTQSFYICAFSGIDKPKRQGEVSFSKNLTDALLRYDLRTESWHEVERHNIEAGGSYPHHDPSVSPPPHGWLNGPDNCLALGDWLYAVAKDNSLLVRYDLRALADDPHAGPPPSEVVLGETVWLRGLGAHDLKGHSILAFHDGWLYVGHRTSSTIIRLRLDDDLLPIQPIDCELIAQFDPYDPVTMTSANLTDMCFDRAGRLYVMSARPARVYRLTPDPATVFDGRDGRAEPWVDLAALTENASMKSENVLCHESWLYVTSGDGYGYQQGADGTIYRVRVSD